MLKIRMFSDQELGWVDVRVFDPKVQSELLTILKKEETIPKMAKEFREAGLIKDKEKV